MLEIAAVECKMEKPVAFVGMLITQVEIPGGKVLNPRTLVV